MSQVAASKLGEETPIFCRRCGCVLYGQQAVACETCSLPHFHCPQCGNLELVHTLRPAVAPVANRAAVAGIALWVGCKIIFFVVVFVAWFAAAYESSYESVSTGANVYNGGTLITAQPQSPQALAWQYMYQPLEISLQTMVGFGIFGFLFGAVGRMLLLRWKNGLWVGLTIALLVSGMLVWGATMRYADLLQEASDRSRNPVDSQLLLSARWSQGMLLTLLWTEAMILTAAMLARPLCLGMLRLLTPRRWSQAILQWEAAWTQRPLKGNAIA